MSFLDNNDIQTDILEYEIECKKALNDYRFSLIDDIVLESSKNRLLTDSEKKSHMSFIDRLKKSNLNLKKKVDSKKSNLEKPKKGIKIRLRHDPKEVKKQIEDDTRFFDKISKKAAMGKELTKEELNRLSNKAVRTMQTAKNNPDIILDSSIAISEINKACDAADNMSYAFDNAYTSLRDPKTSDFRTQDAKIADEMAMRAGANMRILMDTINDIKIKQ